MTKPQVTNQSNEKIIRKHTEEIFYKSATCDIVVRDEFNGGTMNTRTDLAVFSEKSIIFVEIKSDRDTLIRLENQLFDYQRYADKVVLILDIKHKKKFLEEREKGRYKGYYTVYIYDRKKLRTLHEEKIINKLPFTLFTRSLWAKELLPFLWHSEIKGLTSFIKGRSGHEARKLVKKIYTIEEIEQVCKQVLFTRAKDIKEGVPMSEYNGGVADVENKDVKQMIFDRYRGKA